LDKELFDRHRFYDLAEMKRRLAAHLHWYNHARTHHALGGLLVPADRFYGRAEEVLARIEAGGQRDGDELELALLKRHLVEKVPSRTYATRRSCSPACSTSGSASCSRISQPPSRHRPARAPASARRSC
jgi:hypothetical protein